MPSILETLRNQGRYWFGRAFSKKTPAAQELRREKSRPKAGGMGQLTNLPWFLPYVSNTSDPKALRYIYRQMTQEPSVKAGLHQKAFAVASLDLQIQPVNDQPLSIEIAKWVKYALLKVTGGFVQFAINLLLGGLTDGWNVQEKLFRYLDRGPWAGRWTIGEFAHRDTFGLDPEYDTKDGRLLGIREHTTNTVHNTAWLVLFSYLPLYGNVMGQSDLWAAYRDYYMLDTALKLRMIGLDRWTLPILQGTYTDSNDKPDLDAALRQARAMSWFSVPEGVKIEALKIAQSGTSDFEAAINSLKQSILMAITLAYLQSSEGTTTGARSMGEVHAEIAELPVWYLAATLCQILNEQVIPDLVDLNYVAAEYPTAVLGGINAEGLLADMQVYQGAKQLGVPLSKQDIYKRFNLAKPLSDADTLDPGAGQQQPPLGQPMPGGIGTSPFSATLTANDDESNELQQTDYTCGTAALRHALQDLGQPEIEEQVLATELGASPTQGTTVEAMLSWCQGKGMTCSAGTGQSIQTLMDATANGQRVLCAVQAWGTPEADSRLESGHWVAVKEVTPSMVKLFDPSTGEAAWTHREFTDRWIDRHQSGETVRHLALFLAEGDADTFVAGGSSGGSWAPYEGPQGGTGWKNTATGRIVYGPEKPGGAAKPKAPEEKPAEEKKAEGIATPAGSKAGPVSPGKTRSPRVPEKQPRNEQAASFARADSRVTKPIQRYSEEHNQPVLAKVVGGDSIPDNAPTDVEIKDAKGRVRHGIELKTMLFNKKGLSSQLAMGANAQRLKAEWVTRNQEAAFHTIVFDDRAVFNAKGEGKHDPSQRSIYYRRGFGAFTVGTMHKVKNMAELKALIAMDQKKLPVAAKFPAAK